MLNTVIIEDEKTARQSLTHSLLSIDANINVIAQLSSVKESIDFFSRTPQADLIFCDVQLEDGLSFEIFSKIEIRTPVIFITGYDQFVMNAFEYNGIDYLLKPVSEHELQKAITKYRKLGIQWDRLFTEASQRARAAKSHYQVQKAGKAF